jgi:ABC-2 type transport system ATP-binding protein
VGENLLFAARLSGLGGTAARRAVADAVEAAGLSARAAQPARQLSTGWRRLVDLTRALLHRPDLLILDEPTVGLDPEHRERAWQLVEAERRTRGTTVLFSTHYLAEAERCDRVVMLAGGRVVADGPPTALEASLGDEILEIEGIDADGVVSALRVSTDVLAVFETGGGLRVGIRGGYDATATSGRDLVRFVRRPVTLDDVYFARTLARGEAGAHRHEALETVR